MSEKRPKDGQKWLAVRYLCSTQPKPRTGRILGYVAQNQVPRAPIPPATPRFLWFPSLRIAQQIPTPSYRWSLGGAGGQHSPRTIGGKGVSTGVPGAKKNYFFKVLPRPLGMLKQAFLGRFEPVVARFGPWKIPKCLENGPFQDQKWVKDGSKMCFSKRDPRPSGMLKQVLLAHFEPVVTCFGPWKIPKCLENGSFWGQKWVKNGSKMHFSRSDPGPLGMLGQVFLAHFEPIWTGFGPWKSQYSLKRGRFGSKNG